MEETTMNSEYNISEVVEIGRAQEVILGQKGEIALDDVLFRDPQDAIDE
jgi:hypothetical protein